MARDFNEATPQYLERTITLVTAYPFSIVAWFRKDTASGDGAVVSLCNDSSITHTLRYNDTEVIRVESNTENANSTGVGAINAWTHGAGVFTSAASRTAYRDGGNSGSETTSVTFVTPTIMRIGAADTGGLPFPGAIAEVAIYNIALSATEVAMLARAMSPLMVRPEALVSYVPLIGRATAEPDLIAGGTMTHVSTPSQFPHPHIHYIRRPQLVLVPAADAGATGEAILLAAGPSMSASAAQRFAAAATLTAQAGRLDATAIEEMAAVAALIAQGASLDAIAMEHPLGVATLLAAEANLSAIATEAFLATATLLAQLAEIDVVASLPPSALAALLAQAARLDVDALHTIVVSGSAELLAQAVRIDVVGLMHPEAAGTLIVQAGEIVSVVAEVFQAEASLTLAEASLDAAALESMAAAAALLAQPATLNATGLMHPTAVADLHVSDAALVSAAFQTLSGASTLLVQAGEIAASAVHSFDVIGTAALLVQAVGFDAAAQMYPDAIATLLLMDATLSSSVLAAIAGPSAVELMLSDQFAQFVYTAEIFPWLLSERT